MNDRGWKEDALTEKHVNNIDNFLANVITKYSTILLNDSPTSYRHAHNLDQNMNYKYNTLDPHETSIDL